MPFGISEREAWPLSSSLNIRCHEEFHSKMWLVIFSTPLIIPHASLASFAFMANIFIHLWPLFSDIGTASVLPTTSRVLSQKEEAISNYFYTAVVWTNAISITGNSMLYLSINIFVIWIWYQAMWWKSSFLVCSDTPNMISFLHGNSSLFLYKAWWRHIHM